jgi:hypothetical protein
LVDIHAMILAPIANRRHQRKKYYLFNTAAHRWRGFVIRAICSVAIRAICSVDIHAMIMAPISNRRHQRLLFFILLFALF